MENTINYNLTHVIDYTPYQLRLPIDLSLVIDKLDPMWSFLEIVNSINLRRFIRSHKGNQGYDPIMMMRVILFAYMNHVYSLRAIEEKCKTDIRFMYLCQDERPSFMAFQRFISNQIKGNASDIFTEIMLVICKKMKVNTRILYLDGTSMEANANKFSFVWKKTAIKTKDKTLSRIADTIGQLTKLTDISYTESYEDTQAIGGYIVSIYLWCSKNKVQFALGKGHHKTPVQKAYEELKKLNEKLKECQERIDTCGSDRNSYSKTDHDATFMHMKYDYYNNTGVFKPGYNVQLAESDEFIMHVMVSNARSDTKTFIPFMDSYEKRYKEYPGIVVADAGYGSYDNYMYCLEKDIEGYLKYQNYRYEKTAKFKKDIYRKENLLREENGKLICPQGREFVYKQDYQNTKTDYPCITQVWECKTCNRCPLKKECTKAKTRAVRINPILDELKAHAKELLDSEAGVQLRQQRCIQAEGTFGIIKNDWQYNRIHRRGMENVENELYLICMGFNLMKYHQKKMRMILS